MRVWRMAMRFGNHGYSLWPQCLRCGVAAITYQVLGGTDLSKYAPFEPRDLWDQLEPSQKASLARVAYEIQPGDTIYVKESKNIVCRGKVTGPYQFDREPRIKAPGHEDDPYTHQVPVAWEADFVPVQILLGAEPITVLELTRDRLRKLESTLGVNNKGKRRRNNHAARLDAQLAALEGQAYRAEALFRTRNRALIEAKKLESDGTCSVCGFSFRLRYKGVLRDCLVAHHTAPIGTRRGASRTTLDDIDLLCPNCHVAVHSEEPPITSDRLRRMLVSG